MKTLKHFAVFAAIALTTAFQPAQAEVGQECEKYASSGTLRFGCYQDIIDRLNAQIDYLETLQDQIGPDTDEEEEPSLQCVFLQANVVIDLMDEKGKRISRIRTDKNPDRNVYAVAEMLPGITGSWLLVEATQTRHQDRNNGTVLGYVDPGYISTVDNKYCDKVSPGAVYWPGD